MSRYTNPVPQYLDDAGNPLVDGKLYFYETGTSTLADTYADSAETILNSNPVILSGSGEAPNIFFTGTLKVKLTDSDENQSWERDPVTSGTTGAIVTDWDALVTYGISDVVRYDFLYYISLQNDNINKAPDTETSWWATYPNGDIVCDTVTADTVTADDFVGDLQGEVTEDNLSSTSDTPDNVIIGTSAEFLLKQTVADFISNLGLSVPTETHDSFGQAGLAEDTAHELGSIDLGTVTAGQIFVLSGATRAFVQGGGYYEDSLSLRIQTDVTSTATVSINSNIATGEGEQITISTGDDFLGSKYLNLSGNMIVLTGGTLEILLTLVIPTTSTGADTTTLECGLSIIKLK